MTRPPSRIIPSDAVPFVGREVERRTIFEALTRLRSVVLVCGGPGVGKTRLLQCAATDAAEADWDVESTVATAAGHAVPLAPFLHLLGGRAPANSPELEANRIARILRERADHEDALLVVDDVQHLDAGSAAVVRTLSETEKIVVLLGARSGEALAEPIRNLMARRDATTVEVAPFGRTDCDQLVDVMLAGPVMPVTHDSLWLSSRGNALMLRELVRASVADGTLQRNGRGGWELTGRLAVSPLLRDVIGQRLVGLTEGARHLLVGLTLAGPLPLDVARDLAGEVGVRALLDAELVRPGDAGSLVLVHPLYGEVAVDGATPTRVRLAGRGLVAALGNHHDPQTMLTRARLCLEVRDHDPAILTEGGGLAIRWFDAPFALRCAEAAIAAGAGRDAQIVRANALGALGRTVEADAMFDTLAEAASDPNDRASLVLAHANCLLYYGEGDVERASSLLRRHLTSLPEAVGSPLRSVLVFMTFLGGRPADAIRSAEPMLVGASARALAGPGVGYVAAQAVLGRPDLALPVLEQGFDEIRTSDLDPFEWAVSTVPFAWVRLLVLWQLGRATEGDDPLPGVDSSPVLYGYVKSWLASAQGFVRGHLDDSVAEHTALGPAMVTSPLVVATFTAVFLATVHALRADVADARAQLAFIDATPPGPRAGFHWWTERARTLTVAAEGDAAAAIAQSLLLAEEHADEAFHRTTSLHDVARLGRPDLALDALSDQVEREGATWWDRTCRTHTGALVADDGQELLGVADALERGGLDLYAAEALVQAHRVLGSSSPDADERRARITDLMARCGHARTPALASAPTKLTGRELEVARLAAGGLSNRDIADRLGTSARTVGNQLQRVYDKLDLHDRGQLARLLEPAD